MVGDILILVASALLFWAPLGRVLLGKAGIGGPDQGTSLSIAIGMGFWGYCVLLMGSLGLIHGWSLAAGAAVLLILLGARRRTPPRRGPDGAIGQRRPDRSDLHGDSRSDFVGIHRNRAGFRARSGAVF